jgi:type IV pilus assembly protein PilC
MNKKSQLQFAHRCSVLLESGISLPEALELILNLEKRKSEKLYLQKIYENVSRGVSLSKSIARASSKFNPTLLSMITFGESSGILALSLRQGLEIIEKGEQIKKKLVGALIYPGFIALATFGMTLFLVMYIFPKIIPLFSSLNITLPLLTRAVRGLYRVLAHYGIIIGLSVLFVGICCIVIYKKKVKFRYFAQDRILKLPILGLFVQKYHLSSSCRSVGTLLNCGQTLTHILHQISESTSSEIYKEMWKTSHDEVNKGISISMTLRRFKNVPQLVPDMLSIGEKTGSLSTMFHHVSRMFEEELDNFCKQLGTVLEPVLMIGMGLIVGSVALSIILPIYEVTNHLSQ